MSVKKCKKCKEQINWDDEIYVLETGDIYHEKCVTPYPIAFALYADEDDDDSFIGTTDDTSNTAFMVLYDGDYINDDEEAENE